jgi:dTDP-4-amino-4,6-dideoxygalactose transaminase
MDPLDKSASAVLPQTPVPFLDLRSQYAEIRDAVMAETARLFESQQFILGAPVQKFEDEIAAYCGARFAVGCASGSDALMLALMALGIGPGDEVLTSPYTFFATAGSIAHLKAVPVFADVDAGTFNLDVDAVGDVLRRRPGVRAILPVHLFGGCADMDAISRLAGERGIPVIEDAAQAIGAEYKGRRAGSLGHAACFSFFPSKNLGGFGDGGMITTNDAALAERLRALRVHGATGEYRHEWIGVNSRLDALQAVVLSVKLRHLDGWTERRQRNAQCYRRMIAKEKIPVTAPAPAAFQTRHVFNQFVIRAARRDALRAHLAERGIATAVYYPIPLHLQACFASLGYRKGDFPVSEQLAAETLALPVYPQLAEEQIEHVAAGIASFYAS